MGHELRAMIAALEALVKRRMTEKHVTPSVEELERWYRL